MKDKTRVLEETYTTITQYCPHQEACKYYKETSLGEHGIDAIDIEFRPDARNLNTYKCKALEQSGKKHSVADGDIAPQRKVDCSFLGMVVKTTQND